MTTGEIAFLALVLGCFTAFAVTAIWLRIDYVKLRTRHPSIAADTHAHPAE